MGKATRWLKGLVGMKKDKEKERENIETSSSVSSDRKEKKRWSFGKSVKDNNLVPHIPMNFAAKNDADWLRSYFSESDKEQSKHAIKVAAATSAAADAALTAAQAAMTVVRLTNQGRGNLFGAEREKLAAVRIQTVFKGYLARKALRALKGLVKIQALVRGYLVRKRATATLHSMQALVRAQNAVRIQRVRRSANKENGFQSENRPRRSIETFDDARSEFHSKRLSAPYEMTAFDDSPKIVEIDTCKPRSRSRRFTAASLECGEDVPYHGMSSPLPCPVPARISMRDWKNNQDFDWYFAGEECTFSTSQFTPRIVNSVRPNGPVTPTKSVCRYSNFRAYSGFPNYMTSTQSFEAKLRSHSAPKQRPEPPPKKRLSLNEIMASRNSISSVRMQRSSSQLDEDLC